jgi:hypothetical protein
MILSNGQETKVGRRDLGETTSRAGCHPMDVGDDCALSTTQLHGFERTYVLLLLFPGWH